jgi:hypothetical protein
MKGRQAIPSVKSGASLEELVKEIGRFEAIIADWDESQRGVVVGLKRGIEELHKEAWSRTSNSSLLSRNY